MFELSKDFSFEAAHHLPSHDGKCHRVHGHSWKGKVVVAGNHLQTSGPKAGMLVDYSDLKAVVQPIVEKHLDHWDLNETLPMENPTSEEIARWFYQQLLFTAPWADHIAYVQIDETCTSACRFYPHVERGW
jgi:6-pyruvoyltetrahydropterin/6-carboxytetrahydropterin synthase